jgi:hypothetical protein
VQVPQRDWESLSIPGWELRQLERVHRGDGFEAFHIAYTLGSTHETHRVHLTGLMARPYLPHKALSSLPKAKSSTCCS